MQAAIRAQAKKNQSNVNPCQELLDYLYSALEVDIKDPVQW
jgi:hypothetical protein